MIEEKIEKKILCSIGGGPTVNWREEIEVLKKSGIKECALLLNLMNSEDRRQLFRELDTITELVVPFIQAAHDMELWECDYLITKHHTEVFSLSSEPHYFSLAAQLQKYKENIIFENAAGRAHADLFTDEALTRSGVVGICLHLGNLENDRMYNSKKYQISIHALDHHPLKATRISPLMSSWWRKVLTPRRRRLESLSELDYLKHVPANYMASLIIIDADNTLDEQKEIKEYIRLLLS